MNLPDSIVVTTFITAAVWLAVAYQPNQAIASTESPANKGSAAVIAKEMASTDKSKMPTIDSSEAHSAPSTEKTTYASNPTPVKLSPTIPATKLAGITKTIALNSIDQLWVDFGKLNSLHDQLKSGNISAYVLYRDFDGRFENARVTIGYNTDSLKHSGNESFRLPSGNFKTLLSPAKHSDSALRQAWSSIDYSREVSAVLERHQMNRAGQVTTVGVCVLYR